MKEVKALYRNGGIEFLDPVPEMAPDSGPIEVVVRFPEDTDEDPWKKILDDPTPRPRLLEWIKEVEEEIAQGKAEPLDCD
jgi:hypothetical protein